MHKPSPLAPEYYPTMANIEGVRFAVTQAGFKYQGRDDLLYVELAEDTSVAGVLTTSKCPSAPVEWCRQILPLGRARRLLVNSGNANAFTGAHGRQTVMRSLDLMSMGEQIARQQIYLASTGVIGEPMQVEKLVPAINHCIESLAGPQSVGADWMRAAQAIMTTDTFPKMATVTQEMDSDRIHISGICKGSGMIAPDMATMLAFLFTDAPIAPTALRRMLQSAVADSLNCVTVDGDMSTSDTCLCFATGMAQRRGVELITEARSNAGRKFRRALDQLLVNLARQLASDGEGARKLLTVRVTGASTSNSAKKIAMSIANSPLVKTAVAGEDANWGRVVMAVGKAGQHAERDRLRIAFGPHIVAEDGMRAATYEEPVLADYMRRNEIEIHVDMNIGKGRARVWSCDLTKEYVAINGDYRS